MCVCVCVAHFLKPIAYLLAYWPGEKFDTQFMTIAAGRATLNISYEGLLLTVIDYDKKVASPKKHALF